MAIARTQAVSATANSVAITATSVNDVIVVWAYTAGSTTIASVPAGFTSLFGTAGVAQAARLGYKVSGGLDNSSGVWTSATAVVCMVFSGAKTSGPFGTTPTLSTGNGITLTWPANTLTVTNGTSVWLGFGGASSATAGMTGTPTGTAPNFTNRTNQVTVNGLDTAATASNLSSQSMTITTSGRVGSTSVELLMQPVQAAVGGQFFRMF